MEGLIPFHGALNASLSRMRRTDVLAVAATLAGALPVLSAPFFDDAAAPHSCLCLIFLCIAGVALLLFHLALALLLMLVPAMCWANSRRRMCRRGTSIARGGGACCQVHSASGHTGKRL